MKIEKIGQLYILKGRASGHYCTASGSNLSEVLAKLFYEIAIIRSEQAWFNK